MKFVVWYYMSNAALPVYEIITSHVKIMISPNIWPTWAYDIEIRISDYFIGISFF